MILAAISSDVYTFDGESLGGRLILRNKQLEYFGSGNGLQYGVYKVKGGNHNNAIVVGFRGTDSFCGGVQDLDLVFGGKSGVFKTALDYACKVVE